MISADGTTSKSNKVCGVSVWCSSLFPSSWFFGIKIIAGEGEGGGSADGGKEGSFGACCWSRSGWGTGHYQAPQVLEQAPQRQEKEHRTATNKPLFPVYFS
jgi:hypothetical protein